MGNLSCTSSSWTSSLWERDLRVFMTRTMAASICRAQAGEGWESLNSAARRSDHEQESRDKGRMKTGCCILVGRFKPGQRLDD